MHTIQDDGPIHLRGPTPESAFTAPYVALAIGNNQDTSRTQHNTWMIVLCDWALSPRSLACIQNCQP
jgi:hypothetical protein